MTFGYVQGREREALAFFEARLKMATENEEIQALRRAIEALHPFSDSQSRQVDGLFPGDTELNNSTFRHQEACAA